MTKGSSAVAQKRKNEGSSEQPTKKVKEAAKQPPPQKQQQQGGNKKQQQKQPEPEPEEEEEEDEDAGEMPLGERDEDALKEVEKVQGEMDKIMNELAGFDDQMNAEIYAIQKKFLLKKRPILAKRDKLLASVPKLWTTLLQEHMTFASQFDESDEDILNHLTEVSEEQIYSDAGSAKQQITGVTIYFTFSAGSKDVKAGKFKKEFKFDEEKEILVCVPTPTKDLPFTSDKFEKENPDSFFVAWFLSDGVDEGVLCAQDALSSELLVDPLQLFAHLAEGGSMPSDLDGQDSDDEDDDEGGAMAFEEDDGEAPELVDDEEN